MTQTELSRTEQQEVTLEQVRKWLFTDAIIDTPYGTAKSFGGYYDRDLSDLFVGAKILDPFDIDLPGEWNDCPEALQNVSLFYTREHGWEPASGFLDRRATTKLQDIKNADSLQLSPLEIDVLLYLRKHCISFVFGANPPKIEPTGQVWCEIDLGFAQPERHDRRIPRMHGRDFVKCVRALEKGGLYISYGSYVLHRGLGTRFQNGLLKMVD